MRKPNDRKKPNPQTPTRGYSFRRPVPRIVAGSQAKEITQALWPEMKSPPARLAVRLFENRAYAIHPRTGAYYRIPEELR